MQCLSFGHGKPLQLGRCGAVLLDDTDAYRWISQARSDGRDLAVSPWILQQRFSQGWHYCPTLETCQRGIDGLASVTPQSQSAIYPDCRDIAWQS
jgi:hypothetical protein